MNILQNLIWAMSGKVATLFSGLFVGILVARYLGPEQYGLMNYVISYVFLFQTISVFGLDNIEIREEARQGSDHNTIIGTALAIRIVISVMCIVLCVATSIVLDGDAFTTTLVAVYSSSILLNTLSVIRNYFFSIVENKYVVKSEISRTVIGMLIKCALLYFHVSLEWFVVAYAFDGVLLASGYMVSYRNRVGSMRKWRYDKECAKLLVRESFPLMLTSAAFIIYQRIDQVMIGQMISKESVGHFSVASKFVEILLYIPMIFAQTVAPVLVKAREKSSEEYYRKGMLFMNISFWCSMIASAVVSVIAYWLIVIPFGEQYLPAVAILQVMSFKAASVALSNTAGTMLVVEGLQRWAIFRDTIGCIVCVGMNYLLLPRYGVVAAAVVAILSNIASGYLADCIIPQYRHLFIMQTKTILFGWRSLGNVKEFLRQ